MRCFIAASPPEPVRRSLHRLTHHFSSCCTGKPVEHRHLHATFFFWADLPGHQLPQVVDAMQAVNEKPFQVFIRTIDCFYHRNIPGVLNCSLTANPIYNLHNQLAQALNLRQIPLPDKRPFKPHITLMRIKKVNDLDSFNMRLKQFEQIPQPLSFCLDSITLYQSILSSTGPTYTIIHDCKL